MRRILTLLLAAVMAMSVLGTSVSAAETTSTTAKVFKTHDEVEPEAIKICSVNDLRHYLNEYHYGKFVAGLDINNYSEAFFKEKMLFVTFLKAYASSPHIEIASVNETETTIEIETVRPDEPHSPDMARWILVLEMDRDMPEKEILVNSVKFADVPYKTVPVKFTDVPVDVWYASAVSYVSKRNLMTGSGNNQFKPNEMMTRGMLVTVLWRLSGNPEEGENVFIDVPEGKYYTKAVNWAAKNGIVTGIGDNRFDPEGEVTREQMVTIYYRYMNWRYYITGGNAELSSFEDGALVQEYAVEAMKWAVGNGIITGSEKGGKLYLNPQSSSTRAQVAAVLLRTFGGYPMRTE